MSSQTEAKWRTLCRPSKTGEIAHRLSFCRAISNRRHEQSNNVQPQLDTDQELDATALSDMLKRQHGLLLDLYAWITAARDEIQLGVKGHNDVVKVSLIVFAEYQRRLKEALEGAIVGVLGIYCYEVIDDLINGFSNENFTASVAFLALFAVLGSALGVSIASLKEALNQYSVNQQHQ